MYIAAINASNLRTMKTFKTGRATSKACFAALAVIATLSACATHKPPPPAAAQPPPPPPPPQSNYSPAAPAPQVNTSPLPGSIQDFVVNVGDHVYFDFDKAGLRPDAMPILASQATWLERYPAVRVRIEGNCDERGTREYNFALGARRADAVREFLIAHGVNGARITTISYGKERPIDPGHDEAAWARNRNARTAIVEGAAQ
jgi:peptidoglycan-associated lipoprotein